MAEKFEGFANSPEGVDPRDVEPYSDESDAGKIRTASQTTPSSIVAHKTEGVSTDGPKAAVVGPTFSRDEADASDADAAGGEEDSDSEE